MYASAKAWRSGKDFKAAIPYWQSLCEQSSLTLMNLTSIEAKLTDEYIDGLSKIDPDNNSTTTTGTIDEVVLLSQHYYKIAYKSYVTHDYEISKDKRFGWALMGYWASERATRGTYDPETRLAMRSVATKKNPIASVYHAFRTYIMTPATFAPASDRHQQLWWSHAIPKRFDALIVFGFWAVSIILGCVNYESFVGNLETPNLFQQNWQYTSDRTGILSYACLPFLWLFSGRNNIFLWVTNFNVQSFNMFHRHVAWVCTIYAIVHSINYTVVFILYDPRYYSAWKQNYFYMGVVATILMSLMLIQSMTLFRRRSYETFIIIHVVFALVTIYALFRHTNFDGQEFVGYLWSPVALWILERLVRFGRLACCNLNVRFGKQFQSTTSATVTYNESSDLITIEMTPAATGLKPSIGQHFFLYQPVTLRGWENHPFSLGAWVPASKAETEGSASTAAGNKLVFWIRPYDGWTRRLRNQCRKAQSPIHPKLLLEGPYCHSEPLYAFNTILIVFGRTGIAAAVPYLLDHIQRVKEGKTKTTRIQLVWSVRQREIFDDVFSEQLAHVLEHPDITTTLFCTRLTSVEAKSDSDISASKEVSPTVASVGETKASGTVSPTSSGASAQFMPGRPNIRVTIATEVNEARNSSTNLGVLTCGPAQMADECRSSLFDAMRRGFQDIDYFEEAFEW
ncbi:FAD-binding 8 [Penicillium malachiteum]|uniref:FAD-binding 8 n=1 Tax=Penicillium malachiteum TaxID=1324776 RepID=UPI0025498696|nr:FAD-binding 8 [Penicillium malachiteum]KAJ5729652.1 FAD-binding 8 [Penicillium malachiteum]